MSVECCCFRQIEENDEEQWVHVDGSGRRCWPDAPVGSRDAEFMAEPPIESL